MDASLDMGGVTGAYHQPPAINVPVQRRAPTPATDPTQYVDTHATNAATAAATAALSNMSVGCGAGAVTGVYERGVRFTSWSSMHELGCKHTHRLCSGAIVVALPLRSLPCQSGILGVSCRHAGV